MSSSSSRPQTGTEKLKQASSELNGKSGMVKAPADDPQSTTSSASETGSSRLSPSHSVQFSPSGRGLPGGDMQLSRDVNGPTQEANGPQSSVLSSSMLALPAPGPDSSEQHTKGPSVDENDHQYVGLVNQAMTCYLNSLVQSLYMTPEFRNAIYEWEYKSQSGKGSGESSIACQIQKLFLLLQTTDRDALETTDLTTSFGWTSAEAYDQHDVQELCRLMFDALELRWKKSKHEKLIQELYRGTLQDFVKCLNCNKENVRTDFFLDLPLAVKPFGATEAYKSIEEALSAFVEPELLDGSNQYYCENCGSKQDAHKGLRVTQFPYLLTIQLKRFDFDYTTMHRIKLNDRMTFPDVLNLNPFVHDNNSEPSKEEIKKLVQEAIGSHVGRSMNAEYVDSILQQGPYVYELFSVMVHQGSAAGGHYFAYIKNMVQDRWFCFNDTRVESASPAEIEKSYGGSYTGWSSSNTNAYMLMYRQVDRKRNKPFLKTTDLPHHIISLRNKWKQMEEEKEKKRIYEQSLVRVVVELNMMTTSESLLRIVFRKEIPRTHTLQEIYTEALKFFSVRAEEEHVETEFTKTNARLILVRNANGYLTYDMLADYTSKVDLDKRLEQVIRESKDVLFLLDLRRPAHTTSPNFLLSPASPRTIEVCLVDITSRAVRPPYKLNVPPHIRAALQVKQLIGAAFGDSQRDMINARLVFQTGDSRSNNFVHLSQNNMQFDQIMKDSYAAVPTFYYDGACKCTDEVSRDRTQQFEESIMYEILDRKKFAMVLRVKVPSSEEINKAIAAATAYQGPTWTETMSTISMATLQEEQPGVASPLRVEEYEGSGRASSSASVMSDDAMLGTDSLCNNTPQLSPNVSDAGDMDEGVLGEELNARISNFPFVQDIDEGLTVEKYSMDTESSGSTMVGNLDASKGIVILDHSDDNVYTLDVDSRLPVGSFKKWLAETMCVDSSQFVLNRHHSDDLSQKCYEVNCSDDDRCENFSNLNLLSVRLRPPLKPDEKLVHVIKFDLEEPNKDNWKGLFDVPASKSMLVGDLLLQCQRAYQQAFGVQLDYRQIRLRDQNNFGGGRSFLHPNKRLEARSSAWNTPVFMQIVTDERLIGAPGEPVYVRRFRPSTVEVGPIQEVLVDVSSGDDPFCAFRRSVATASGIPFERVEITEPMSWDPKWPCVRARLDMLDGQARFVKSSTSFELEKSAWKVYYYRDSDEKPKELSEEERKQITIKDNTQSPGNSSNRRKERPLRIQMSSISEG